MKLVAALAIVIAGCGRINFAPTVPADASDGDSSVLIDAAPGCGARLGGGRLHMCAINAARELFCWGDNDLGQIRDGTAGVDRVVPTPSPASGP